MSGALFLLDIVVFVLLVYWIYGEERRPDRGGAERGLFAMRARLRGAAADILRSGPRWGRSLHHVGARRGQPAPSRAARQPRWRAQGRPRPAED